MTSTQNHSTINYRNLIAACAAVTVFGFASGMTYPLLSLILESRGVSSDMIGMNAAMMPLGILLFSPFIPAVARRFSAPLVAIVATMVTVLVILSYKIFDSLSAWFLIRLIEGMSTSTLYVLGEAWVVGSAGEKNRGKIVAIYASVLAASFGAGPLLVSLIGISGWLPFALGSAVVFLGVIPLLFVRDNSSAELQENHPSSIFSFAQKAPVLLLAVAIFAIFDAAVISLLPVYGMKNDLNLEASANILTVLMLGNLFLQLPIGWMCDYFDHRRVLMACALLTAVLLMLLPAVIHTVVKWPLLLVVGATGYGVYTVVLTELGKRFKGAELVNGIASFSLIWGLGALWGSVLGGWVLRIFEPHGLPISLACMYFLLAMLLIWRRHQRSRMRSKFC